MADVHDGPAYLRLAELLVAKILDENLQVGDPLPSTAEIEREFDVKDHIARHAIRHLREQGIVRTKQGTSTTIARRPDQEAVKRSSDYDELKRLIGTLRADVEDLRVEVAAIRQRGKGP